MAVELYFPALCTANAAVSRALILGIIATRALGITVWYPAVGVGGVFSADVTGVFCFAGYLICITASRATGYFVTFNRRADGCAGFSCRTGAGIPAGSRVAGIIAAVALIVAGSESFLLGVVALSGAALSCLGIIRTIFGAVAFPTAGAGGAFFTYIAAGFAGRFIGKWIIGRALGGSVALNRGVDGCAGFAVRAGTGCPTVSTGIVAFIAECSVVKFLSFLGNCKAFTFIKTFGVAEVNRALEQAAFFVAG